MMSILFGSKDKKLVTLNLQEPPTPELKEEAQEEAFLARLDLIVPWGTYGVAAVLVVVFLLEWLTGGSHYAPALWRMGANVRARVVAGEVWRLLSCAFLHIGLLHLCVNVYALLIFGPFLERLLGRPRFFVLYGSSALGGGAASAAFREAGLSAGASGAIWGLMVGGAALALRPSGLLPAGLLARLKKTAWQPVALNFFYSFSPGIEAFGHFGGGLVGGLLVLSGLLTGNVARPLSLGEDTGSELDSRRLQDSHGMTFAAAALCLSMAASVVTAIAYGRPWELRWPPSAVRTTLLETPFSLEITPALRARPVEHDEKTGTRVFTFGEPPADPLVVRARVFRLDERGPVSAPKLLDTVLKKMESEKVEKGVRTDPPKKIELDGWPVIYTHAELADGTRFAPWITFRCDQGIRVDVAILAGSPAPWSPMMERFIRSLQVSLPRRAVMMAEAGSDAPPEESPGFILGRWVARWVMVSPSTSLGTIPAMVRNTS